MENSYRSVTTLKVGFELYGWVRDWLRNDDPFRTYCVALL